MYTLTRLVPLRQLLLQNAPALIVSIGIAELFYKFHSFALECGAFLATWYVLDGVIKLVVDSVRRAKPQT